MECKQVYHYGLRYFFRSYYNFMDWAAIALYLASYSLRIIVDFKVQSALSLYRAELRVAHGLLVNATCAQSRQCPDFETHTHHQYVVYRNQILSATSAYWLRGCKRLLGFSTCFPFCGSCYCGSKYCANRSRKENNSPARRLLSSFLRAKIFTRGFSVIPWNWVPFCEYCKIYTKINTKSRDRVFTFDQQWVIHTICSFTLVLFSNDFRKHTFIFRTKMIRRWLSNSEWNNDLQCSKRKGKICKIVTDGIMIMHQGGIHLRK